MSYNKFTYYFCAVKHKFYIVTTDTTKSTIEELSILFWEILRRLRRGKQRFLEEYGLTNSQMEILQALFYLSKSKKASEITQIHLSKFTNIDPMTTSTIIRNLEKKKLLFRKPSDADSRALCVIISEKGQELMVKVEEIAINFLGSVYKGIDTGLFISQMEIILDNLKEYNC